VEQEAFMNWDRIVWSWKQLKDEIVPRFRGRADDKGAPSGLIGAVMSGDDQSWEVQTTAFRPDDRGRRSEFSLHIGS
jgi:hypothetical protein